MLCAARVKKYALDRKMIATFLMDTTSSSTMQSFGEDHKLRAGCRCENAVFVFFFLGAMHLYALRVLATATFPSVRPSVTAGIVSKRLNQS